MLAVKALKQPLFSQCLIHRDHGDHSNGLTSETNPRYINLFLNPNQCLAIHTETALDINFG